MADHNAPANESIDRRRVTRRSTLSVLGAGALGVTATSVTADRQDDDRDRREAAVMGPDPAEYVDSTGEELTDPADELLLFDPEPEFPPSVEYEQQVEEFGEPAEEYLEPHGAESLLDSRRLIVDPNGEAVSWGRYSTPEGTATIAGGREDIDSAAVSLELEGLIPGGIYTVWVVHRPTWHRPLGGNAGEENVLLADAGGNGELGVVDQPDELTLPPGATADDETGDDPIPITVSPLDQVEEFVLVGAYHYDNRTWDSQPGPFFVPQFTIPFGMDE